MADIILVYGSTGSFKTVQLLFLAKYAYRKWGKTTRLASVDGGGWKPLDPAVDAGLIEAWGVSALENPRSVLRKLSQGYWPKKTVVGTETKLILSLDRAETQSKIGVVALEGLTSIANIIMRDALNKQLVVSGDQKGEKGAITFTEKVDIVELGKPLTKEEKYSFPTQGNYNDAQKGTYDFVTNLKSLPVPIVYVTALETRGEEEDTKKTIIGPAVVGKAVTAQVGSWVGDQIHMEDYFVNVPDPTDKPPAGTDPKLYRARMMQETRVRAWFIRHPDPLTGMLFPAKPRLAPDQIPALLEVFPGGYFVPTVNEGLDVYLDTVDSLQRKSSQGLKEWMAEQDRVREAALKVGAGTQEKADPALVKATMTGATK